MGTKLYVGGLPYSVTEQQLQELFSQQGAVTSAKIITDRQTGQARGFGFVEMATSESIVRNSRRTDSATLCASMLVRTTTLKLLARKPATGFGICGMGP